MLDTEPIPLFYRWTRAAGAAGAAGVAGVAGAAGAAGAAVAAGAAQNKINVTKKSFQDDRGWRETSKIHQFLLTVGYL